MSTTRTRAARTAAGAGGGTAAGILVLWALDLAGVEVDQVVAGALAGVITTAGTLIAHEGIRGIAAILWRGRR